MNDFFFDPARRFRLRRYQSEAVTALREMIRRALRRIILQAETGAGKSVVAAEIMRLAFELGTECLFVAHRRELVDQFAGVLGDHGVPHSLIMARRPRGNELVQVASKATLMERAVRRGVMNLPKARLVIVDECHLSMAPDFQKLLGYYGDAVIVGLTATPARADGKGLSPFWQGMHSTVPTSRLIADGHLVPTRVFSPHVPDLRGVRRSGHEWHMGDCEKVMKDPRLIGNVVQFWLKLAAGRQTILFATGVNHSRELCHAFRANGVRAAHIDAKTDPRERDDARRALAEGDLDVLCNVGILPEGVDIPEASCVALARPSRSFVFYRQAVGRGRRPCPEIGKTDNLLLDFGGVVLYHGVMPDADIDWELTEDRVAYAERKPRPPKGDDQRIITCPNCFMAFEAAAVCPGCGHVMEKPTSASRGKSAAGQLVELTEAQLRRENDPAEKQKYWHRCCLPDSVVFGKDFKTAKEIKSGDLVYGHDGRLHRVVESFSRNHCGRVVSIKARGLPSVTFTDDHPVLIYRRASREFGTWRNAQLAPGTSMFHSELPIRILHDNAKMMPAWVRADDVRSGDLLVTPRPVVGRSELPQWRRPYDGGGRPPFRPAPITVDPNLAWMFGFYIGDGTGVSGHQIRFALNPKDPVDRILTGLNAIGLRGHVKNLGGHVQVVAYSSIVADSFRMWFGSDGPVSKVIPSWLMTWPGTDVIDGLRQADGHAIRNGFGLSTTSRVLAHQARWLLLRDGRKAAMRVVNHRPSSKPNNSPLYTVDWRFGDQKSAGGICGFDDVVLHRVVAVRAGDYDGPVWNFEVDGVHSYVVDGIATHNCLACQAHRGATIKAAAAMYRARYGEWPDKAFRNYPPDGSWNKRVADVFPGYILGRLRDKKPPPDSEPGLFAGE